MQGSYVTLQSDQNQPSTLGVVPCGPSYETDAAFETHLVKTLRGPTDDIRNTRSRRDAPDTATKGGEGISVLPRLPAKRDREAL
jgi:hypothetical protein